MPHHTCIPMVVAKMYSIENMFFQVQYKQALTVTYYSLKRCIIHYKKYHPKCFELGWTYVPLAVETYGNWGMEAQETFSCLASLLVASHSVSKSKATADIYGHLNLTQGQGYPGQGERDPSLPVMWRETLSSLNCEAKSGPYLPVRQRETPLYH